MKWVMAGQYKQRLYLSRALALALTLAGFHVYHRSERTHGRND